MAIDKNSKAYQNLLKSGYTDEQITQMHSDVAGGQSTQQAVANTQPTQTPQPTTPTPTTPEVKQETVVKQQETVGSTVPEIKQEGALKPLSQDYYNQTSSEAQEQIVRNLNNYKQTNPEFFKDYESFKKNFSYDARNEEQKNTLDTWYGGYQKGMQLSGIPTTDLYTQYKDGQVSAAELENLRVANPTKYAELQAQINKGNIVAAYDDDKGQDQTPKTIQEMAYEMAMQTFNQFMSGDSSSGASNIFREYEDKMNDPEMLGLSDKCTEVQEQMENIQSDLDSIKKQVEAEYAGTGATRSKIKAIISDRSYDLQLQLRTLNSEYNKYATQYNNRMQQYQTEFTMQLQEYQINQQERNQKMNELGFALDLMNFETNDQKAEREWNYWVKQQEYTNGNINSSDYQTRYKAALNSVQNLLAQYPNIPMVRSAEQMADDILKAIDGGSNLGAELTKINKQIQQKPEYKYLYNNTFGNKQAEGIGGTYNIGGTEYVMYNGKLMTASDFNTKYGGVSNANAKKYTAVSTEQLKSGSAKFFNNFDSKYANGKGGQCGKFVNDYLQTIGLGRYYDNDLSTKLNSVNSLTPSVGDIAIFDYNHKSADGVNYGHVGIVTGILPDGRIQILDSNYGSDGKIQERLVEASDASLKGFFNPTIPYGGVATDTTGATLTSTGTTGTTTGTQTALDRLTLQAYQNGQINKSETLKTLQQLVNAGFSEEEISNAINRNMATYLPDEQRDAYEFAYNKFIGNDIVQNFQSATEQLLGLSAAVSEANGAGDLSTIYQFMRAADPRSVVREGEFEMAAQTMGLGGQVQTWFSKLANGERLTAQQRQNFIDTTVKVLEAKKKAYKLVYDEAITQMKAASIPSAYYPTDWASELDKIIASLKGSSTSTGNTTTPSSSTRKPNWYYSLPTSTSSSSIVNIGGYNWSTNFY